MDEEQIGALEAIDKVAPDGWRKRVAAFFFQLGLGTQKGAELYQAGRDAQDVAEGRSIISRALAGKLAELAVNDPDQLERAKARFLGKIAAEQDNLESVLVGAQKLLLASPPSLQDEAVDPEMTDETGKGASVDSDWLASFTREAEAATSESLRDRLARVLAGEFRSPGSFPRSVFRVLVELEKADIEAIQRALSYRHKEAIYLGALPATISQPLERTLVAAGLVNTNAFSHGGFILRKDQGGTHQDVLDFNEFGLIIESKSAHLLSGTTIFLNRAGMAAFDVLDQLSGADVPRRFAPNLMRIENTRLHLCSIARAQDGFFYSAIETLHDGLSAEERSA